jgi:YgiT-type zinc finger domain-containing protein
MKCVICHSTEIVLRQVDEHILRGEDLVLVPVKVLVCKNCGERYYDRRTLKHLEEIESDLDAGLIPLERIGEVLRVTTTSSANAS